MGSGVVMVLDMIRYSTTLVVMVGTVYSGTLFGALLCGPQYLDRAPDYSTPGSTSTV